LFSCIQEVLQVCRANPSWPSTSKIVVQIDPKTGIWADERQFFTVINHLIQNSIAFCPPGNEIIHIKAFEEKNYTNREELVITIEDNGTGIPEELREKIFEPFYTNRADGTGLGLAIVKQTLEGHKGSIDVSTSSMKGAKFTIKLPLF
jgi:signal transduction histidine kinase